MARDWYERRRELRQGDVFLCHDGSVVKLTGSVPGDGSAWRVADYYGDRWHYEERRIEPCDLKKRMRDPNPNG